MVKPTREVSASCPERVSHRGHGQDDVQVVGALGDEVLPDRLTGVTRACLHGLITHLGGEEIAK